MMMMMMMMICRQTYNAHNGGVLQLTESDVRAVARWEVGSYWWVLSRCLKVYTVGAFRTAAGISFQILGDTVAEGMPTKLPKSVVTVGTLCSW